ncbi:MAG: MATE family efflux transporter, partial [Eubacteriales bacterium]|nr:MATE family efflux transporter [Eubacteriales bacterium]
MEVERLMKHAKQEGGSRALLLAIFTLAWPTILEQILQTAVQYVDTAMVSRLGAAATAAVGVTTTINWLIGSSVSALGIGFLAFIAKEFGAKNFERARQASSQVVLAALVSGALFTALALSLSGRIPVWMHAEPDIQGPAAQYFFILSLPMLPRAALILFSTALRA